MESNFEKSRQKEVNEISDDKISSEQLSETEKSAENFDDCSLDEVKDSSGNEVNSETLEDAEDDFEDCEAKIDELEEENPELNEEDDNFDDCGNETEGQYVAEVTYTTDGEVSDEEIDADLQEAYDECDDPEDMQQLKENANENEHIEVVNAEVVERPEEITDNTEEYEEAKQECEEAQETLEEQQEAAEEYEEKLSENIEKEDTIGENINEINAENNVENDEYIQEDDKNTGDSEDNIEQNDIVEENEENNADEIEEEVEEETSETLEETDLSDEEVKEVIEEKSEETEEAVEEQTEEKEKALDDAKEAAAEEIDESVEENVNSEENLSEDEIKEKAAEDTSETLEETDLSDEEVEKVTEEKSGEIEKAVEDEKDIKEFKEETEETAENFEEKEEQSAELKEEKNLSDRIDAALDKEDSSYSELNDLAKENAYAIESIEKERSNLESEMSDKFDEVLSKERGTDEYKEALQEYNALKDHKAELDEKYSALSEQQDTLERKSAELREAQIAKGSEAMAASADTLAGVNMLQERYDQTYYDTKADKTELANIREESCSAIKELSAEKDSIKQAMDAKMDEISEYVISNNMDRYDTAHDLRYQQMSAEYNAMKESYDKIGYSIVKLDENNKAITEQLGDEYVSMTELPPSSRIPEVNNGTDVPGETDYFIDEAKASEVLSPFKQDNWEQLTVREQKQAVEKLADYNAEILGVDDKPRIVFFNKPPQDGMIEKGYYDPTNNAIFINEHCLNDSTGIADTVSHEYRHKYQHIRAEKLENERDLAFRDGFDNYKSAGDDYAGYLEYRNQLVEVDARAYGQAIKNKINTSEISSEAAMLDTEYESLSADFSELNPEKGAVFEKVAINELSNDIESKENEVKNFKELRSPKEVFEADEIARIKEKVAPAYTNGMEIAKKIKDGGFDTYKEHNDLESGHIEKVREKSLEAADVLSEHFAKNNYDGLYSPDIDNKTVEMMAIYHDTGMDANIDADNFNGELSAKQIRDAHSLQAAIHALRDRDFIESNKVNADEVALGCLLHSKSNSGVTNLSSAEQWETAISGLKKGVDEFNKANPSERITFDTSFVMTNEGSLRPEILAQLRSESLALRIGDANGHDSKSDVSQSGKDIAFNLNGCELQNCGYSEETIKKIEKADGSGLLSEVQHSNVYIDGKLLTNEDDATGISRAFSLGEGNFKSLSFESVGGTPCEVIKLENCDAYPLSTQFCIEERIKEINTAKIDNDYVPERLAGMSDEGYNKLKSVYANQTAKIDSQIIIDLSNASNTTMKSYKNFAAQIAQKYNIEVKVR